MTRWCFLIAILLSTILCCAQANEKRSPDELNQNNVSFYLALRRAAIPAELHIFEKGPHGVGLALANPVLAEWPTLLANWLRDRGLLEKR